MAHLKMQSFGNSAAEMPPFFYELVDLSQNALLNALSLNKEAHMKTLIKTSAITATLMAIAAGLAYAECPEHYCSHGGLPSAFDYPDDWGSPESPKATDEKSSPDLGEMTVKDLDKHTAKILK